MLEVCFSDSAKGALAFAQHCEDNVIGGAVGLITNKKGLSCFFAKRKALKEYREKQKKPQRRGISIEGRREDIAGISFGLSEGDIQSPISLEDCPRKDYIRDILSFAGYDEQEDIEKYVNEFWRNCIDDWEKLKANPKKIRIWLDHTPDARCGLLFAADLLKNSKTEIHLVELPERIKREDQYMVEYRGWGEVDPQLYGTCLAREKILTEKEITELSNQWQLLKIENAPLRVVEHDVVISADECYYDDLIKKEFPQNTCKVAEIIGNALGKQKILTGDVFIAKRIQQFIKSGELVIVNNEYDRFYNAVVRCVK